MVHVFSCEFCKIFKSTVFTEHRRATASYPLESWARMEWYKEIFFSQKNDDNLQNSKIAIYFHSVCDEWSLLYTIMDWDFYFEQILVTLWNFIRLTPAGNYMFKVNNRSTRTRCEILCSSVSIVNFEHVNAG